MNIENLKNLLRQNGLKPNFTYGQNFLVDDIVLQDIVDAAEVNEKDAVLEIGPGVGNLTRLLCERSGFLLSVEKDPKFVPILHNIKKDYKNKFRFEVADALQYNFQDFFKKLIKEKVVAKTDGQNSKIDAVLNPAYKVVANIPYYVTGKILQMLLAAEFKPETITVLTQKEVAEGIVAKAGDLSVLAISVQLYGEPKIIRTVLAKSFYPAPKVDSAVLQIKLFKKSKYKIEDEKKFFRIVKACFSGKRKQIHNTLASNLHLEKNLVEQILKDVKISPSARPQELSIEQWMKLAEKIS